MFKQSQSISLLSRVRQHIIWLTLALFVLFSLMTVFIVFSLEDAIFKQQLQENYQTFKQGGSLPSGYSIVEKSEKLEVQQREKLKYFEFDDDFGEFNQDGKHYHFMNTEHGVLLLDSTDRGIFTRIIDDILLLIFILLLPSLALTYWVSSTLSAKALKPFTQFYLAIANENYQDNKVKEAINDIEEHDIKLLATKLVSALDQKATLLEEQIVFNQGMAHEIRTPLQVMSHSIELMEAASEDVAKTPAFRRLEKSIVRVNRISTALLWLTSNAAETHDTKVMTVLNNVLEESQMLLKSRQIEVKINEQATLTLPLPEVVLELIVFNLLNNVIHHGQIESTDNNWQISITEQGISFTNPVEQSNETSDSIQNFGLGLMLVNRLANKFDIAYSTEQEKGLFKVSLMH